MKFSFKFVTALIAVILTVCCIATVFAAADVSAFTDFPAGSWSDAALRSGVNNGLIQGKGDGRIAPKDYITRAETAAIINRAFGATVKADISQYTDVSPSKWYYAEMQKAVNMRTVEGVSSTQINPEGYITREQVFAILARALVISDTNETKLMTFADGGSVSSWARGYTAALVNRGYVNGNAENRLKPKDYITREEFAQIMHNIFKQYIVGEDYKLSNATYGTTVVRTPNLTLNNLVINGDLIIADGVGRGDITLKNVRVSGRILFRGGEGKVKIEDGTTTGQFVIVHDVNGTVNFHNYRTHPLFKGIVLDTHATFLKPSGGSSGSSKPDKEEYTISFDGKDYFVTEGGKIGDAKASDGTLLSDAIANYEPEAGYTNKGFRDKATGKDIDLGAAASGNVDIEPIDELTKLYAIYDANGGTMKGVSVYKDEAHPFDKLTPYTLLTEEPVWTGEGDYTFAGWYIDKTTQKIVTTIPAGQVADVTLYAKWIPYSILTFEYNSAKSDEDTVAIDVVIDKLPYGVDAITYIDAEYSFLKDGTSDKAKLTYDKVTSEHGGTLNGSDGRVTLDGVSIKAGGILFTIEFTKEKDYAEDVKFDFGTVIVKEGAETVTGYNKKPAVINSLTGLQKLTIEFNGKEYYVYNEPGATIGSAKQIGNEGYTLAEAMADYEKNELDKDVYNFYGYVNANNKNVSVKAGDLVSAHLTLTKIIPDIEAKKYDVIYHANGKDATVNGFTEYKKEDARTYFDEYTLDGSLTLQREGYKFLGWSLNAAEGSPVISKIEAKSIKDDAHVYAQWQIIEYKITYYDTRTVTFVPAGAKTTITKEDEYILPTPEKAGYNFLGWYDNPDFTGEAVTKIEKGTLKDLEFWAKWEVVSVLSFACDKDEDAQTVKVTVILSNIPDGIEDLAAMSIYFTQTPNVLKLEKDKSKSLFPAGLTGCTINDGAITWANESDPITADELLANGGKLFELVYSYTLPVNGDVVLAYTSDTELASSSFKVADRSSYTMKSATIPFGVEYTVITYTQKVTDAPDADPKTYDESSKSASGKANEEITYTPADKNGFTVDEASVLKGINDGNLVIKVYYNRNKYTVEFNGEKYDFLYEQKLFQGTELGAALKAYAEKRLDEGFIVTYTYGDDSELDPDSEDIITGEVTIKISEVPVTDEKYTVTFYNGTTENKGSIEVEAGSYVSQADVDKKLGSPEDYKTQKGYTNSDGVVHEIYPELWYKDGEDWKIFKPEKVKIVKDTDVYLLTRYVAAYYDTDFEFRGIKLPQKEIVIPYDSDTDLWESAMDTLAAARDIVASTLYDVEYALDVDLFTAMLEKAAKTGVVDADGNILNPVVPVPLHKLLTEELIMKQIDSYIDSNINNEEFIAEILRNDTVVDMILGDASIREKVLSDADIRAKLLTTATIKKIIANDEVIEWIITNEDFKKAFIDSDATFDYIVGDLKELLANSEYHDMIIDACVEFVIDVYFEKTISAPELVHYIDTVLDSPEFIADIESKPKLRTLFKNELKGLLTDLDDPATSQETRDEVYAEIRGNNVIKDAIIDAVLENDDIMDSIMEEVRTDLSSATSKYRNDVITAVRTEFADSSSTLKAQIIAAVKDDLKLGSASALRDTVIDAITTDFNSDASQLKDTVITTAKTEIITAGSPLRASILAEAATQGSDIAKYIKNYASTSDTIKQDIKPLVKDNADVKAQAWEWINANIASVNDDIKGAVKTDAQALKIAIAKSDSSVSDADAQTMAEEYVSDTIASNLKAEIDSKIDTFFANDADVLDMVEDNFDIFYSASYDTLFDELYADSDVFDKAYESYVSDSAKLEDAFNKYVSVSANLDTAVDKFIENTDNLADAIELFIDSASTADIEKAANIYIADDDNLISAVNTYIEDDNNLSTVFDIFKKDEANLNKAFETYIADDGNLGDAIHTFATNTDVFDEFYEDHLSENADKPETFNKLFEAYYHTHVHDVADKAWDNADLHDLVMQYVHDYTEEMVADYADGTLETEHPELVGTIDELMHNRFPEVMRQKYYEEGSTIKTSVDRLIEEEGTKLIKQYANDEITDADTVAFIEDTIEENIDIIVDDYVAGTLDADVKALIDSEIDSYMEKLINDYINDVGDARDTLGELVPTYAQDAVDALKDTDAFKNTISDFTSGNGVRVNEGNIMFISILSDLMAEYDFDKIMADFAPEKVTKLVEKIGHDLAAKYVNALLDTFVDGIEDAEAKLQADLDNDIEGTEYKFTTTPRVRVYIMDDFVADAYNKAMPKIVDKLRSKELIAANPYAKRLLDKNWIKELLDYDSSKVTEEVSGYSLKKGTYDEEYDVTGSPIMTYIDIVLENAILLYDAAMWYGDNCPEATIEDKLDALSALMGTYANKANDIIMHYINTGELPKGYTPYEIADKILNKVLGVNDKVDDAYDKFEDKYYENEDKILELVDKIKNFYADKLDRDYTELIDLKEISVYADGREYPLYKIALGIYEENDAFNIDTLAAAIDDSANYHNINKLENAMNKLKSKLAQFEEKNIASALRIIRNAYKFTLNSREIKGHETGTHTVKLHRYFE